MSDDKLTPEEWYAQRPSVYASAGAFITDEQGRVLLVKPNYRPDWLFPGGQIEMDEYPHLACAREVREEVGLDLPVGDLLVVHWSPTRAPRPRPMVTWLFDGGTLDAARIADIRLQEEELDDAAFVEPKAAPELLGYTGVRVAAAFEARTSGRTVYIAGMDAIPNHGPGSGTADTSTGTASGDHTAS
ncbi:NUDIX domain-containing protein [Yinghuangia soli]|uniref:NUDIX hydrolase n=1 Tax=Yinghuangia soli TaxID=2908204 RepID=A0AA41Q7W9_9ACTN|nr:NUDIX hydrolase [Yinghuangia soli]MCF2533123.1 NUDIX hydrolase [Yinghuangia soli]